MEQCKLGAEVVLMTVSQPSSILPINPSRCNRWAEAVGYGSNIF